MKILNKVRGILLGKYTFSPCCYDEDGNEVDRTFDSEEFNTIGEAEEGLDNWGSKWVLWPYVELCRQHNLLKRPFNKKLVVIRLYREDGVLNLSFKKEVTY